MFIAINAFFFVLVMVLTKTGYISPNRGYFRSKFNIYEHNRVQTKNMTHYTLPLSKINASLANSTNSTNITKFHRGIVSCDHFESEVSCDELNYIENIYNSTLNSTKYIYVNPKQSLTKLVDTLSTAFIISIITKRKIVYTKQSEPFINIPIKKLSKKHKTFSWSSKMTCNYEYIIKCTDKSIYLKGKWDPTELLLDPFIFSRLTPIMRTHYTYFMFRCMLKHKQINLPDNQFNIGISLQFDPDPLKFLKIIKRLTEGYTNWTLNIWNPKKFEISRDLLENVHQFTELSDCFFLLAESDVFLGSLGYKESHILTKYRGRAGKYLNPLDSNFIEMSNSQAGELFLTSKPPAKLMCPNGAEALQSFISFNFY